MTNIAVPTHEIVHTPPPKIISFMAYFIFGLGVLFVLIAAAIAITHPQLIGWGGQASSRPQPCGRLGYTHPDMNCETPVYIVPPQVPYK